MQNNQTTIRGYSPQQNTGRMNTLPYQVQAPVQSSPVDRIKAIGAQLDPCAVMLLCALILGLAYALYAVAPPPDLDLAYSSHQRCCFVHRQAGYFVDYRCWLSGIAPVVCQLLLPASAAGCPLCNCLVECKVNNLIENAADQ